MRLTESRLRRVIRSVILESMDIHEGEIDIDELCLDAIEHFYISPSTHLNYRGDDQYNAFVFHYCFDRGMMNKDEIVRVTEHVKEVLQDVDSVAFYLSGNKTQRGMKIAQEFSKKSYDIIRSM